MFGISEAENFLGNYGLSIDLYRHLLIGGLIFARIFIICMFIPYLGVKPVPGRVRVAVSMVLTLFFYSPVDAMAGTTLPTSYGIILSLFFKEALFAILLGFAGGLVFFGIQAAGNMIDNQRQLANAQIFNPGIGSQASLFGIFYYQLAIVIFLIIGGHRIFIRAIAQSFEAVPVLQFPDITPGLQPVLTFILRLSADTLIIALQLGAPVLVAIFIADIILGLTNRVAPMVNVFELGFNIKGFLGVLMVYLALPMVIVQLKEWFIRYLDTIEKMIQFFLGI